MQQIVIKEDFLSLEETNFLLLMAKESIDWDKRNHYFWDDRVISLDKLKAQCPESVNYLVKEIYLRLKNLIKESYKVDNVFADTLDLVRWFDGLEQSPHVDEIPHAHRKWGSVLYLNNDYEGGQTFYPNFNLSVSPKPGMAVVHLGDQEHLHGVTKIKGNTRYTIASFWGIDPNKTIYFAKNWN